MAVTLGSGGLSFVSATSPSDALTFVSVTPCRVADTRPGPNNTGDKSSPLGAGEVHTIAAHGSNGDCTGIPNTATALSLNVTAVGATDSTFLTIWAAGEAQPTASSLNPFPGEPPTPNAVTTGLSPGGEFSVYNFQGDVNLVVDINGYYLDHHHDDRYFTKSEVDARFEVTKAVSLDPAAFSSDGTYMVSGSSANTGLFLEAFDSFTFTVVIPPDKSPGSTMFLDVLWHIDEECAPRWRMNFVFVDSLGSPFFAPPTTEFVTIIGPTNPDRNEVQRLRMSIAANELTDLEPGQIMKVGLFRGVDPCVEPLIVDAAQLTYS